MAQAKLSWNYDWENERALKEASSDRVVTKKCQHAMFSVVTGAELGGSGGAATKQQLHCGAAGRHILGTGASEERQGFSPLQHYPE